MFRYDPRGIMLSVGGFRRRPAHMPGNIMGTLQQQIAEEFLAQLEQSKKFSDGKVEKLRAVLFGQKKPKADDFVKIFTEPDEGDIK